MAWPKTAQNLVSHRPSRSDPTHRCSIPSRRERRCQLSIDKHVSGAYHHEGQGSKPRFDGAYSPLRCLSLEFSSGTASSRLQGLARRVRRLYRRSARSTVIGLSYVSISSVSVRSTHLSLSPTVVDDSEEAMDPHRVADFRGEFSSPLWRPDLREVDDGQVRPVHYQRW